MPLIGITGGIATGKSTVTRLLAELGAVTFSADEAARAVMTQGSPVLEAVKQEFGTGIQNKDGSLNRKKLAAVVFSDPEARRKLESITHPAIGEWLRNRIDAARSTHPDAVIAVEVPLLYEAGMASWFDKVVVVAASPQVQAERLRGRDAMSEQDARNRIESQLPIAEKAARADIVIWNEGSPAELVESVRRLWKQLA